VTFVCAQDPGFGPRRFGSPNMQAAAISRSNQLDEDLDRLGRAPDYFFSFGVHSRMAPFLSVHSPTTDSTMQVQPAGPLTP
jgi:hypothetical protein